MQGPGSEGMRHRASPSTIGSERFDTPHLRHEPGGACSFHQRRSKNARATRDDRRRARRRGWIRCLTSDGLGRNTHYMQYREAPSAGVTWCNEQRRTRLPLLGASAVTSRRRRTTAVSWFLVGIQSTSVLITLRRARGAALTSRRRCSIIGRRSSADREHLATNEGVGSSNLSDGVKRSVGGGVSGSAQGVVNP